MSMILHEALAPSSSADLIPSDFPLSTFSHNLEREVSLESVREVSTETQRAVKDTGRRLAVVRTEP